MAVPSLNGLKLWVGTLFTKDDWDYNFSQIVSWLADGTGDLVVNTVKATNGIDMDGAQISNVGAATSGSQAINLDQATTLLNRTSFYYPFSVASGKVNSNGDSAYLQKDSDTQVTVLAGNTNPDLVCIQSDGTMESITSNTVLTIPGTDGIYHIIKEKGSAISITSGSSGKVTIAKTFPVSQSIGDYYLDNSVVPFIGYKYTASGWEKTPFCYLGYVTVSSGTATVKTFNYNDNNFDVISAETYFNGSSWYIVYANGWCEQGGYVTLGGHSTEVTVSFLKPYIDTNYNVTVALTNVVGGSNASIKTLTNSSFTYGVSSFASTSSAAGGWWRTSGFIR